MGRTHTQFLHVLVYMLLWNISFIIIFFYYFILLLFNYSCLHLLPTPPPHTSQTHLPPLFPSPSLVLSMCPLSLFLKTLPPIIPSHLPSGYCQIVLNFNVSIIFCLLFFFLLIRFQLKVRFLYLMCSFYIYTYIKYISPS